MTDTVQETLTFEGEPINQSRLTFKGAVPAPPGRPVFHRDDSIAVLSIAKVAGITFETVKDATTRTHKAAVTQASVVDIEVATDLLEEQLERSTGQMRLLSMEGEARRAAREVLAARRAQLDSRVDIIEDEDGNEDAVVFAESIELTPFANLRKLTDESDSYDLDEWYERCQDELVAAGATILAGVEWCRRRLAEHEEAKRSTAVDAARAAAERTEAAAAVHSDDEADRREQMENVSDPEGDDEDDDE